MSMKTLLSNATAKALLISVAGACILAAAPVTAASAATLSDLYRSQFVVRNCRFDFNHFATAHYGTDFSTQPEDTVEEEILAISSTLIGKLSKAVEAEASFTEPTDATFDAIFDQLNSEVAADVESFCANSIPVATGVFASFP